MRLLSPVEDTERVLLAEVLRHDAVLQQEEVVPLGRAVVLSLSGPEEPGKSGSRKAVNSSVTSSICYKALFRRKF